MAFCPKCGTEIPNGSQFCPKCGARVNGNVFSSGTTELSAGASAGLKVVSFLFPIIGWILYFAYKNDQPVKAGDCAKFAWIGFGVGFVLGFISGLAG